MMDGGWGHPWMVDGGWWVGASMDGGWVGGCIHGWWAGGRVRPELRQDMHRYTDTLLGENGA